MLDESQRDRIGVVLVRPRNPLNIGAAARAMANFGFERLAVVDPFTPNWRQARSAVGAPGQLRNAGEFAALAGAVADCTLVVGTASRGSRKPGQRTILLPDLAPAIGGEIAGGGRVALVFGSEKHGLTREDLSLCHLLVEIPTDSGQPSMNLGQAVAVCLYEAAMGGRKAEGEAGVGQRETAVGESMGFNPATSGALELLSSVVEEAMLASGYSPAAMRAANRHDLRVLLRRMTMTEEDARRTLRLFRRILWRLRHIGPETGTTDVSH